MPDWLRLAVGTFTAWPVPAPRRPARDVARWAVVAAPLVQLPLVAILALAAVGLSALRAAPLLLAAVLLVVHTLASRGLHLDGLADTCDGLAASYDRDRALAVMRRGDVGPAGATALVLVLLVDAAALAQLATTGGPTSGSAPRALVLAAVAVATSRQALAWACRVGVPAARGDGLGATVAGRVPAPLAVLGSLALSACAVPAAAWAGLFWWTGPAVVAAGVAAPLLLVGRCRARLGGITGDVLGAVVETSLACALTVGALVSA